jgi:hypothetical protein
MKSSIFNFSLLTFNLIYKAYQSLKSLFDPAAEGTPYDGRKLKESVIEHKKPLFAFKRFGWR